MAIRARTKITVAAIDAKNGTAPISIWFQRYRQRINMGMNWQKNKPTSTVYLEPFNTDIVEDPKFAKQTIIATYPGWIAIAAFKHFQIDLINLSTKNVVKIYPLGMDNSRLEILEKITFYQHRQQANDIDDGMRLILHLKYDKASFSVLQIWNANSCQLLQSTDFDVSWDGRVINASLLFFKYYFNEGIQLFYRSFSKAQLHKPRLLDNMQFDYTNKFRIHMVNSNEIIILIYSIYSGIVSCKAGCVLLTPNADLTMPSNSKKQLTTTTLSSMILPSYAAVHQSGFYSIDYDRVFFYCTVCLFDEESREGISGWQRYIKVFSLSKGLIFERDYPSNKSEKMILITRHNLAVFYSLYSSSLAIISLLDGEIRYYSQLNESGKGFGRFEHLIDSKLVGYSYNCNKYCIIDVVTGDLNIHSFPISAVQHCTFAFDHMLLMTKETTLITSFVPKLL
ncbi:hypothetical protein BDF19DRAFT_412657 [Syncephalis fuscata]|nr:hypothetical protein BDF19DRAFT_412657 [Syncephalis fuscata]